MASPDLVQSTALYQPPVGADKTNVRVVENRIVVDAPYETVFNFAATWANLGIWLPMTESAKVLEGKENVPMEVGDVLYESVKPQYASPPKVYICRAKVPGVLVMLAGTDEGDDWVRWIAHLSTTPLEGNKKLFCRVFQENCKNASEKVHAVTDPAACQVAMEKLKAAVEGAQ